MNYRTASVDEGLDNEGYASADEGLDNEGYARLYIIMHIQGFIGEEGRG